MVRLLPLRPSVWWGGAPSPSSTPDWPRPRDAPGTYHASHSCTIPPENKDINKKNRSYNIGINIYCDKINERENPLSSSCLGICTGWSGARHLWVWVLSPRRTSCSRRPHILILIIASVRNYVHISYIQLKLRYASFWLHDDDDGGPDEDRIRDPRRPEHSANAEVEEVEEAKSHGVGLSPLERCSF